MDYRKSATDELRRIPGLRAAQKNCQDRISDLNDKLTATKNPMMDKQPVSGTPSAADERWLNLISAKSDEEERLKKTRRELRRFYTAWRILSERDRRILELFYIEKPADYIDRCAAVIHCSARSRVYEVKDEALIAFTRAYYGEVVT